jgi:predicted alpha/beta-hydrolase family hydrolase
MPVTYAADSAGAPTLVLGHGAGAGQSHPWMTRVATGLAARGVTVVTFNFPYVEAGRRTPDRAPALEDAFGAVWREAAAEARGKIFAGGKSMGGRIASQAAARGLLDPSPAGLIFFGYPLHPPNKPAQRRDRHLPDVGAAMLFLHGARDPFGTPDEMRELIARLPGAQLELIDDGDHSLVKPKRVDPRNESIDHALDVAVAWITR